jgi:hypothetical protein
MDRTLRAELSFNRLVYGFLSALHPHRENPLVLDSVSHPSNCSDRVIFAQGTDARD